MKHVWIRGRGRQVRWTVGSLLLSAAAATHTLFATAEDPTLRFEVSFPASAHAEAITGRVFVMLSRTNQQEPRFQIGRTGVPFFGRDVEELAFGEEFPPDVSMYTMS